MFRPRVLIWNRSQTPSGAALALRDAGGALALPPPPPAVPASSADTCNVRDLTTASKGRGSPAALAYLVGRNLEVRICRAQFWKVKFDVADLPAAT